MSATAFELKISGPPTGKGRPKFNRTTGHARTPAKTKLAENRIYLSWMDAGQPRFDAGPLAMEVEAVLERPQSHYRVDGRLSAAGLRAPWPTKTPDVDNLLKLAADALNKNGYRDDAQIVRASVVKRWANAEEPPFTRIRVSEVSA